MGGKLYVSNINISVPDVNIAKTEYGYQNKDTYDDVQIIGLHIHGTYTGGFHSSRIFWEHENLSSLTAIRLIYIKLYRKQKKNLAKNPG